MAIPNYVKFLRGTVDSYNRLAQKDDNTLYFVHSAEDDSRGSLYVGSRLITGDIGGSGIDTLAELTDVIVSNADAGSFLVLNSDGKWVATSASDIAATILAAGGQFIDVDENEFKFNSVNGKLELKGFSTASIGMMPVKTGEGLGWQSAPVDLSGRVGTLETNVSNLETSFQTIDNKIATAIANATHLSYKVINNLSEAIDDNVVYLFMNNSGDMSNRYNEYMLVNGQLEQIGSMDVDLTGYVTTQDLETALNNKADTSALSTLSTRVGSLETAFNGLGDTYVTKVEFNAVIGDMALLNNYNNLGSGASVTDTLIDIYDRLTWQEISA